MPKLSLERLIHSLSQGELRAFSLTIKKDKNPSYYNLFNAIRSGKSDDKKKKDNNEIQRRNYLYNSILESLVKNSKTIDSQISKGLHHVEILYNRQLEREAWKELEKVEKLANKHERFGYVIQILEWKKILGLRLDSFTDKDYQIVSDLEEETMEKYKTYLQAADSYHKLIQQKQKGGYIHNLNDLPDFERLQALDSNTLPKRTLYYQRMAKAIHLCLVQDIKSQYELTKLIVNDAEVIIEANECLQAYFEHLTSCICMGRFEELITLLKKLKLDVKKGKFGSDPNIVLKLFYYAANYETMAYGYMGNESELKLKIKEVELGLNKYENALSSEMKMIIYSALKMAHYFLGNPDGGLKYVQNIQSNNFKNVRRDIYQDSLFFSMLIQMDQNKLDEMESTIQKIENQCDLDQPHFQFEKSLYHIFKDYSEDKISKGEVYAQVIEANNKTGIELNDSIRYTENYYVYYLWASSRGANTNVLEKAREINENL